MLPGEKYKTACWTNTEVKLNYARWAFFIEIMLAGAEAKPCVSHVLQILLLNNRPSPFQEARSSTKGKWPIFMHRHKVNFPSFVIMA